MAHLKANHHYFRRQPPSYWRKKASVFSLKTAFSAKLKAAIAHSFIKEELFLCSSQFQYQSFSVADEFLRYLYRAVGSCGSYTFI